MSHANAKVDSRRATATVQRVAARTPQAEGNLPDGAVAGHGRQVVGVAGSSTVIAGWRIAARGRAGRLGAPTRAPRSGSTITTATNTAVGGPPASRTNDLTRIDG